MREDRDLQEKMAEQGIRLSSTKQRNFRAKNIDVHFLSSSPPTKLRKMFRFLKKRKSHV